MTADQSIRSRERELTHADTINGLTAELDELRGTLATALAELEALLDETLAGLPEGIDADHDALRALFTIELEERAVRIGPAAGLVAVARIEGFLNDWGGETPATDDESLAEWRTSLDAMDLLIAAVANDGRAAALVAETRLREQLEELTAKLEQPSADSSDAKLDALRQRLKTGKIGALSKTAIRDDDERAKKVAELTARWAPLAQLALAGAELGTDASERLNALRNTAVDAIQSARAAQEPEPEPELEPEPEPEVEVEVDVEEAEEEVDEEVPAPPTLSAVKRERRPTLPPPLPREDEVDEPDERDEQDEVEELKELSRPPELVASTPRRRVDTDAPRMAQDTPLAAASVTATMEVIAAQRQFHEPTFRIVTGWTPVTGSEIALAIGPPTLYVVGMTAITIAYQMGLWAENPFEVWPWALPSFFAFGVWAIGMPALSGWRIEWTGISPQPLRMNDRREGGFAEIGADSAEIDSYGFDFRSTRAELSRWRDGSSRGWTLVLRNDDDREARLASVADFPRWDASNAPCAEVEPAGAWRVSEEALLHLADECRAPKVS